MRHIIEHRRSRWTPPCTPGRAGTRKTRARRGRTRVRCAGRSPRWPKGQLPRPQTESMATSLARDEVADDSRTGAVERERFANGTPDRKLLLEVHESATLFTAGDLPFLKKCLKPLLSASFRDAGKHLHHIAGIQLRPGASKHFKTSFSPYPTRCSPSGEPDAMSWCSSIGRIRSVSNGPWDSPIVGEALKKPPRIQTKVGSLTLESRRGPRRMIDVGPLSQHLARL